MGPKRRPKRSGRHTVAKRFCFFHNVGGKGGAFSSGPEHLEKGKKDTAAARLLRVRLCFEKKKKSPKQISLQQHKKRKNRRVEAVPGGGGTLALWRLHRRRGKTAAVLLGSRGEGRLKWEPRAEPPTVEASEVRQPSSLALGWGEGGNIFEGTQWGKGSPRTPIPTFARGGILPQKRNPYPLGRRQSPARRKHKQLICVFKTPNGKG